MDYENGSVRGRVIHAAANPLPMGIVSDPVEAHLAALNARGASAQTLRAYRSDLCDYRCWLEEHGASLHDATRADVRAYAAALATRELAPATRARRLSVVRGLHRRLATAGAIDPAAEVPGPKRPRRLPVVPPTRATERLLDVAWPDTPLGIRDHALIELLYGTGLRAAEACALDLTSVEGVTLRVLGKGGKTRLLPLGEPATNTIAAWLARGRPDLATTDSPPALFLSARGNRLETSSIRRTLARRLRAVGLEVYGPHALRHAYATHMLEGGGDLRAIQELLGHASLATTEIYTQLGLPHLRRAHAEAHPRGDA